jgi:peptide/nickel transport system ATP-binding protein
MTVEGLTITPAGRDAAPILRDVSLTVGAGESLGLVGESGCGKSTLALALLGRVRPGLVVTSGSVHLEDFSLLGMAPEELASIRGRRVALVPQNISQALTPTMRIRDQLLEVVHADDRLARALYLLQLVGLDAHALWGRYPHQLSGGQRQRVALALALAGRPELIVLDEPTTGLDVTTQNHVLELLEQLRDETGVAYLLVSHDLNVVARLCETVVMMAAGRIVTRAPRSALKPAAAAPARPAPPAAAALLTVEGVRASYSTGLMDRLLGRGQTQALRGVSLTVARGETLAVVGESGSGKSTLARVLVGLHRAVEGRLRFGEVDLDPTSEARPPAVRRGMQIVFQNPDASLNPRHTIAEILYRPLKLFFGMTRHDARPRMVELLQYVRLDAGFLEAWPAELSGGERQRVAIARALAARPELVICDEVVSALDTNVQATVLALLRDLKESAALSYVFITHDLALVRHFADRVAVLYHGVLCEIGPVDEVFTNPQHNYTRALIHTAGALEHLGLPEEI